MEELSSLEVRMLLGKYMAHVLNEDGSNYLSSINNRNSDIHFTREEVSVLYEEAILIDHSQCMCKFVRMRSGDLRKVEICNYHRDEI